MLINWQVFEFLFQNKYTADEDVDLEEVKAKGSCWGDFGTRWDDLGTGRDCSDFLQQVDEEKLEVLINHIDFVVVLFYKENDPASKNAAVDVDSIDDNLKERGISIVKTKNKDQIEMSVFMTLMLTDI